MPKLYEGGLSSDAYLKMQETTRKEDEVTSTNFFLADLRFPCGATALREAVDLRDADAKKLQ